MIENLRTEIQRVYPELYRLLEGSAPSENDSLLRESPLEESYLRTRPPREGRERDLVRRLCALARRHRDLFRELFLDICAEDVGRLLADSQEGQQP